MKKAPYMEKHKTGILTLGSYWRHSHWKPSTLDELSSFILNTCIKAPKILPQKNRTVWVGRDL